MKKITRVLGIAIVSIAMFTSTNSINNANTDLSLSDLLNINSANAECTLKAGEEVLLSCDSTPNETCSYEYIDIYTGATVTLTCSGKKTGGV